MFQCFDVSNGKVRSGKGFPDYHTLSHCLGTLTSANTPRFLVSKAGQYIWQKRGGQMASLSAKTMMSVVVFLTPWPICRHLLVKGTLRTRMHSGSTWLVRSCRGPSIFSSVIMRISLDLPTSQLFFPSIDNNNEILRSSDYRSDFPVEGLGDMWLMQPDGLGILGNGRTLTVC